jgi:hypothetical protein
LARASEAAEQQLTTTIEQAREEGFQAGEMLIRSRAEKRAQKFAAATFLWIKVISIAAFLICAVIGVLLDHGAIWIAAQSIVTIFAVLSIADLFGFSFVTNYLGKLESKLGQLYAQYLQGTAN